MGWGQVQKTIKKRVLKDPLGLKGPIRSAGLTQTGNVIGNRFDFTVIQLGSNHGHLRIVLSSAIAISHQLRRCVIGMLTRQARVLRRQAGPIRAVATGASRNLAVGNTTSVNALAQSHG